MRATPPQPTDIARSMIAAFGHQEAESKAIDLALSQKTIWWLEVVAAIKAERGGAGISDPDAWARRLLQWRDPKPPTHTVKVSETVGGPGKNVQGAVMGQHAWLTPAQQAEMIAQGKWMTYHSRHGWTEELIRQMFQRCPQGAAWCEREGLHQGEAWARDRIPHEPHRVFYLGTHRSGWLAAEPGQDVTPEILAQWLSKVRYPLFVSRRQLEKRKVLPRAAARWALDSGGFTEIKKYGMWKLEAREYVGLVRRFRDEIGNLDWAAPMDWMCEIEMTAKSGLSRPQHIARSVASFVELRMLAPDLPFIPVLQGLLYEDYILCAELYERAGIDLRKEPVVGVGSICRRQEDSEALRTLEDLARSGIRLHGFGFKKAGLERAKDWLISADSMAWSFGGRRCEFACPEGKSSCANCLHRALEWRAQLLRGLGPEWQRDG